MRTVAPYTARDDRKAPHSLPHPPRPPLLPHSTPPPPCPPWMYIQLYSEVQAAWPALAVCESRPVNSHHTASDCVEPGSESHLRERGWPAVTGERGVWQASWGDQDEVIEGQMRTED